MNGQEALRHILATLAYRMRRTLRGIPESFWGFEGRDGAPTPQGILQQTNSGLIYALLVLQTGDYGYHTDLRALDPPGETARFYTTLEALDHELSNRADLSDDLLLRVLQGPLAEAMARIGQLLQLRDLAGIPAEEEDFIEARIRWGQVGPELPELE
ncbi:hypothetical protein [Meiothermus granaticius]|uniref:Uncharacterized protein n=1 Tax=Meiothermus granaticius NBRC 107808 TaxID=1227551 RepID=A0A399F9H5_9DEIN|nr:hypothetical protein [Meiothermus granaticius]RIH93307.1 hypothetical protein Mgrana_00750 [Meiothermus granaticius NBRC 107808]GEM85886.1 hypothetical protein MGR01S_05110 [Meiothermus granaticius NBRC 107808]